jgi:drug/metabolite transporter (DMT)-like permease
MAITVIPVKLIGSGLSFEAPAAAIQPLLWLTLVTFGSRLALFAGVKAIGGVQTALIGLLELLVTVLLALWLLGESLNPRQWIGAALLITTLILTAFERDLKTTRFARGWLFWLRPSLPAEQQEIEHPEDPQLPADR